MSLFKQLVLGALAVMISACSAAFDNSHYYMPEFSPENVVIPVCPYTEAATAYEIGSVILSQKPFPGGCGPHRSDWITIRRGGVSGGNHWIPLDGSFGMAGTNYSMKTMLSEDQKEEQEKKARFMASAYYASAQLAENFSFQNNGLKWEQTYIRELTRYPENRASGPNPPPGPPRLQRLRDVYIYKHPEGWWLRVQANFHPEMENYPEILASRRDTLRQVVASIRIEPKDPSRVSCRTDDKGYESCRYRWP
jgi:hypothetical protein